ncbi:MAG: lipid-A-disaccharide synthase [Parahaliea sp.]
MRIGILAGEASGDILGARILAALKSRYPDLEVEGIGGPLMEAQGLQSMFPMERLSVMGLIEPLKRLPELLAIRSAVFRHFRDHPPDLFLGIDSPDFNLCLERKLRNCGVRTAHLVSPSVWAWRAGRIKGIAKSVDRMLCLFPFELDIYRQWDVPADFVGHPLADEIPQQVDTLAARAALGVVADGPVLALLPGSRGGEVSQLAPLFLETARQLNRQLSGFHCLLPAANAAREAQLKELLQEFEDVPLTLVSGRSREVMAAADVVLLASGTATLEAMLLKRPMVVAYRLGAITWALVSGLIKTPWAALPNILAGRVLVPELIQNDANVEQLQAALLPLLAGGAEAQAQREAFIELHQQLALGYAERSAQALIDTIEAGQGQSSAGGGHG